MSKYVGGTEDTYVQIDGKFRLVVARAWSAGHGYHTNRYRYIVSMASNDPAVGRVTVESGDYYVPGDEQHARDMAMDRGKQALADAMVRFQ